MHTRFTLISLIAMVTVLLLGLVVSHSATPADTSGSETESVATSSTPEMVKVNLYYYSPQADMDEFGNIQCSQDGLTPVVRSIERTDTLVTDTLEHLLEGDITQTERLHGITTEFPLRGVVLVGVDIRDGIARVALDDPSLQTSGGSCRSAVLRAQLEQTVLQFPAVAEVRFIPETLFQP